MNNISGIRKKLGELEVRKSKTRDRIFIIDDIGANGAVEVSPEKLVSLKAQAIAKDPDAFVYIIDVIGEEQ